jgi:xanthine dehydrogenase accessory factor
MIGSKVRVKKVLDYLADKGIDRGKLDKIYTPIGLDIGAETPAEIAVAIIAEIIQVKNKGINSNEYSQEIIEGILNEKYKNMKKALVTIVSRRGSAPREVGTKMLIMKDGTMIGTIGGGCVEANIMQAAFSSIDNQEYQLVQVDMTGREAEEEGMVCGGIVEIFVEPIN